MYENSSFWESIMPAEEDRGKGDKQNETATRMEASALPSLPDGNLIQQQPRELRERDAKDVCCTQIQGTPYIKYLCRNLENEEVTHACVMVKIAEEKPQKVILPIEDCCNYSKLHRHFKLLGKLSGKDRRMMDEFLRAQIIDLKNRNDFWWYAGRNGCYRMPDGRWIAVEGNRVIGARGIKLEIDSEVGKLKMLGGNYRNPVVNLLNILFYKPNVLLLTVAYVCETLVRSAVRQAGIEFQAVGWLFGPHGCGKTVTAKKLAGIFEETNGIITGPALFMDCGSTLAALHEAMKKHRDQPLIIDDVALSQSHESQRKRKELVGQLIREGANGSAVTKKKPNGELEQQWCAAGILFTAEFSFGKASDVERCILMKIPQQLSMPDYCDASLMGQVAQKFLCALCQDGEKRLNSLKEKIAGLQDYMTYCCNTRVKTNMAVLDWTFGILLEVAESEGMSSGRLCRLRDKFNTAVRDSWRLTDQYLRNISANQKRASVAQIVWQAYDKGVFCLLDENKKKKIADKLAKHGDKWDGADPDDGFLYLSKMALERVIQKQPGYKIYTIRKIVKELKADGIVFTNEPGTDQVKLCGKHKKGGVRVYKLDLDELEAAAKKPYDPLFQNE